jgi:hypothetical protein
MDDSELAKQALRYALEVHPIAEITVLHLVGKPSEMMRKAVVLAFEDDIEQAAEGATEVVFFERGHPVRKGYALGRPVSTASQYHIAPCGLFLQDINVGVDVLLWFSERENDTTQSISGLGVTVYPPRTTGLESGANAASRLP